MTGTDAAARSENAALPIEWAVANQMAANESRSGDQYLVQPFDNGILLAVVDGLGHGERAADVAEMTVHTLEQDASQPIQTLFQRCNQKLVGTRGVVMSLVSLDTLAERLTWLGVGNVEAILLRADPQGARPRETLLLRGGIVGYRLPNLRPVTMPLAQGDLIVMATDGLRSGFVQGLNPDLAPEQLAGTLLSQYARGTDDAMVLVARYQGRGDV